MAMRQTSWPAKTGGPQVGIHHPSLMAEEAKDATSTATSEAQLLGPLTLMAPPWPGGSFVEFRLRCGDDMNMNQPRIHRGRRFSLRALVLVMAALGIWRKASGDVR